MIAIERNNEIKVYGELPKYLENPVIINLRSATEEDLYKLGFRPFVFPELLNTQKLGEKYKDEVNDVYTHRVVDIVFDINQLYSEKLQQLDTVSDEFRDMLMKASYENVVKGIVSQEFLTLVDTLEATKIRIKDALDNFLNTNDIQAFLNFTFDTVEAQQLKDQIKNFKQ